MKNTVNSKNTIDYCQLQVTAARQSIDGHVPSLQKESSQHAMVVCYVLGVMKAVKSSFLVYTHRVPLC